MPPRLVLAALLLASACASPRSETALEPRPPGDAAAETPAGTGGTSPGSGGAPAATGGTGNGGAGGGGGAQAEVGTVDVPPPEVAAEVAPAEAAAEAPFPADAGTCPGPIPMFGCLESTGATTCRPLTVCVLADKQESLNAYPSGLMFCEAAKGGMAPGLVWEALGLNEQMGCASFFRRASAAFCVGKPLATYVAGQAQYQITGHFYSVALTTNGVCP